jgi:hypothetical protein
MSITNTLELRRAILADLSALRSGELSPNAARVRASMAKQALDLLKMEMISATGNSSHIEPVSLVDRLPISPGVVSSVSAKVIGG